VPPVGGTVNVTVTDASWIVVGQMINCAQAGGTNISGALQVQSKSGNNLVLYNPPAPPAIPLASPTGAGLLTQVSGKTTDFVDGTNNCQDLTAAVIGVAKPTIWAVRQRSFNAFGNPNFEVDQQINGTYAVANQAQIKIIDRWNVTTSGTLRVSAALIAGLVPVPGSNFAITQNFLRITLTTQEPTLVTNDCIYLSHIFEGIEIRELFGNVTSAQMLVRSSIAGLAFSTLFLDGQTSTQTYYPKLWTIPTSNTWSLIQKPNIPVFPSAATFTPAPGVEGAIFYLHLAAGPSFGPGSVDGSWVTTAPAGTALLAPGQGNFAASPVGATFDIAFVQWEPGPDCSGLIDKPFGQNLDECLRYYCKSYSYATKAGTVNAPGAIAGGATQQLGGYRASVRYAKPMAKTPTVTIYCYGTGAANTFTYEVIPYNGNASSANAVVSTVIGVGDQGFNGVTGTTAPGTGQWYAHYIADTGW
jgi:hypothetical protein